MKRTRPSASPHRASPAENQRLERPVTRPPWDTEGRVFASATTLSVHAIHQADFHLPAFQRPAVWSPALQARYCNTIMAGLPTASILIWRRFVDGQDRAIVLDGQQRLTALGARVTRSDGSMNPPPEIALDLATGTWGQDPGRWRLTPRTLLGMGTSEFLRRRMELDDDPELQSAWDAAYFGRERFMWRLIPCYVLDPSSSVEFVVEAFRAINRPGLPITEDEVERLVASAAGLP